MRRLQFDTCSFISEYHQAVAAGLSPKELADLMGMNYNTFCSRKHALKKRGVRLPELRRSKAPRMRIAAKPVLRLMAPVACKVEPAPLSFTITVGADHA
jgi:hypothetical protein